MDEIVEGLPPVESAGTKGGKARQAKLSKEERRVLASTAAKRRWANQKAAEALPPEPPIKRRQKSKPMPKPFKGASAFAERRLAQAIKERAEAMQKTAMLNAEIPSLVGIIQALGGQLPPAALDMRMPAPSNYNISHVMMDAPIPSSYFPPQQPAMATVPPTSAMGGAIDGIQLEEPEDEDMHLRENGLPGGRWV